MSLFIQSGLVGKHPKPFERAAPAGRSTSAVSILLTSTKSLHDTKPPDRDSACLRALLLSVGIFLAVDSILAQAAPAGLCRAVGEVHNGDLRHSLFDRLQDVFYLLHRVS